jgi:hypothetical protein
VGSQVPVAGPSCELGFGKGAAGTLQVIVAGHRSKVLWVDLVHCQGRMHKPDRHSMQIGVEFYLHRDVCIEAFRARGRTEAVFDLSPVFDSMRCSTRCGVRLECRVRTECGVEFNAVLINAVLNSIQSGHLLERLFEQELRYTLGPTVRQECTLTDSRTSRRRGGGSEASFQ